MMRRSLALALTLSLLAVPGCSVPMGGTGATARGEALSAEAVLTPGGQNRITITSLAGWSCSGSYAVSRQSAVRSFPLACTNGATGQAMMVVNAPTADLALQRATVSFRLSNGEQGRVSFGLLS